MKRFLVVSILCTLPQGVFAAEMPWVVGEHTCKDAAVQELVAGGQVVECQIAESGKIGACTISGKCREVVNEVRIAGPSPLGKFAVLVSQKTNSVFNRVGDTITSLGSSEGVAVGGGARPFGTSKESDDQQKESSASGGITVRALLCAPQAYIPSFVARLIPNYPLGTLCGKAEPEVKQLEFGAVAEKRAAQKSIELEVPDSGLFIIADPSVVSLGGRAEIRWGAAKVEPGSCTVTGPGMKERGNWGSASTPAIFETVRFTLICMGLDGIENRKSVEVDLGA